MPLAGLDVCRVVAVRVDWWCGSWLGCDPAQQRRMSEHYVRVGHGRGYGDVAPRRATCSGGASELFVTVEMAQLG